MMKLQLTALESLLEDELKAQCETFKDIWQEVGF